jgi:hypothetical protein
MNADVHVFILWSRATPQAERIVDDLQRKFELVDARRVTWTARRFGENLRRLYGFDLPERVDKATGSGTGTFTVYIVRDMAPLYEDRPRSWGIHPANVKAYDSKQLYREWTGGGFRVHATNEPAEAERDVFLLFGRTLASYADRPGISWDSEPSAWSEDIVGADGWSSVEELLTALRVTTDAVVKAQDAKGLTVRVDDVARASQVAGGRRSVQGRRITVAGKPVELRLRTDGPRRLRWPTYPEVIRTLKVRTPLLARVLARVTRPLRRARPLENRRGGATIRDTSSHRGDESS